VVQVQVLGHVVVLVVVVAELMVVVAADSVNLLDTLDFILHNIFYIIYDAGLTRTIHDRFDWFFRMNWFPTKVRIKPAN
jgi:hypothetical protein